MTAAPESNLGSPSVLDSLIYAYAGYLSPDAARVAWIRTHIADDEEVFELLVHEVSSDTEVVVAAATEASWSPDGRSLAFVSTDASGQSQMFSWEVATREISQLTSLTHGIAGGLAWSPDSEQIAFAARPKPQDRSLPYRVTRIVVWRDEMGLVDDAATDIWLHDCAAGVDRQLTDDDWINSSPIWLEGGECGYLASSPPDRWENVNVIRAVHAASGTIRDIVDADDVTAIAAAPANIGQLVISAGGIFRDAPSELKVLTNSGVEESRTEGLDLDVMGTLIGDLPVPYADLAARILIAGTDAIVPVQTHDRLEIHRVALTGPLSATRIVSEAGSVYPLGVAGEWLLYASGDLLSPPDLWLRNLVTGATQQISDTISSNRAHLRPLAVERAWVNAENGPDVQVKFLRPSSPVPGEPAGHDGPLPTVLVVHGGPYAAWGECFVTDAQALCEAGYGVLLVNPRGSRGYGMDFAKAIDADWGNADYADLMAAVDHAVAQGWSDPERLGVTGLSYGGFMTAWIVANSHRFKAAVYENGVSNLVSMYGTSDVGLSYLPDAMGGTPSQASAAYQQCSPITTAHTARTPTLVIIGEQDYRCPAEQGLQFYSVLRRAGCEAELLVLPGSSHAGSIFGSVAVRRAKKHGLVEWMQRYV